MNTHRFPNAILIEDITVNRLTTVWGNNHQPGYQITKTYVLHIGQEEGGQ